MPWAGGTAAVPRGLSQQVGALSWVWKTVGASLFAYEGGTTVLLNPELSIRNWAVESTPPLTMDVVQTGTVTVEEGEPAVTLSMTNLTCGAPPCVAAWVIGSLGDGPNFDVTGSNVTISAGYTVVSGSKLLNTTGVTLPKNVTVIASYKNADNVTVSTTVILEVGGASFAAQQSGARWGKVMAAGGGEGLFCFSGFRVCPPS